MEAAREPAEEIPVAPQETRFQDRGPDGHVFESAVDGIVKRARGMSDLEAKIPERVEHAADEFLLTWCCRAGKQEEKIEIGIRGEFAASVASHGNQRHPAATGIGRFGSIDMAKQFPDDDIDQHSHGGDELDTRRIGVEPVAEPASAIAERVAKDAQKALVIAWSESGERLAQATSVHDGSRPRGPWKVSHRIPQPGP